MIALLLTYKYLIILPLATIEGPLVMMLCGFFVKLGYLNFLLTYILLMIGDLLGDVLWYGLGHKFGMAFVKRFGKFFNITEEKVGKIENAFHKYHSLMLFLSKITMGMGFALVTLVTAGLVKIPLKRFILWNAFGQLFWTGGLMMIGFFLGNFYLKVDNFLGKLSILSLFIVIFAILIGVAQYMRTRLLKKNNL